MITLKIFNISEIVGIRSSKLICESLKKALQRPSCSRHLHSNSNRKQKIFEFFSHKNLKNHREMSSRSSSRDYRLRTALYYTSALTVFMTGMGYAGVPLYRMFCASSGTGSSSSNLDQNDDKRDTLENLKADNNRLITVKFNADTASNMQWNFRPQQREIEVIPGETALAFYKARNDTDNAIIGISTYNIIPYDAGPYFNKIQCFCFEEQRLNPHEEVDMPVFFYIDPEYCTDPKLENVNEIILSYTFFESKEGSDIPLPEYLQRIR